MNLRIIIISFVTLIVLGGCKYRPFVKYQFVKSDTHLPSFSEYDYLAGSNNSFRSCYDVTQYNWKIEVFPRKKRIQGAMEIWMDIKSNQDTLLFDLWHGFKIDSIACRAPMKYKRKRDLVQVIFEKDLEKDTSIEITFFYQGKPPNIINEGPIIWKKSASGKPWFSTQTEGIGVHHLFPCKDLLIDEPELCNMEITVPEGLTTVANGQLISDNIVKGKNTTKWRIENPINVYNISFNVGDFMTFSLPYQSVDGNTYDLEFYALKENEQQAREFYAQTPEIMGVCESLYGEYPFWNDGLKFVESTFSAMEHQGCIAMGDLYYNDFKNNNTTLIHEIAHEWWGNSVTATDYSDIWLHEGMATFSEAAVIERLYGTEAYFTYCRNWMFFSIRNKRPIQKVPNVRYTSWASYSDQDIYPKGAILMHTIRMQMENDELFFKTLKDAQKDFHHQNISSSEFEQYFINKTNSDVKPYFDVLLRQPHAPKLGYMVYENKEKTKAEIRFHWRENVPKGYQMKIKFQSGDQSILLNPTHEIQSISIPLSGAYKMEPWRSGYFLKAGLKN